MKHKIGTNKSGTAGDNDGHSVILHLFTFAVGERDQILAVLSGLQLLAQGAQLLGQGFTWLDTGTHESLVEATNFVMTVENHQNRKIGCLEDIAYLNGWITREQVEKTIELYKNNQYGRYLQDVLDGKYVDVIRDKKRLEELEK